MPRGKKATRGRGSGQNTPRGGGRGGRKLQTDFVPFSGTSSNGRGSYHSFTLAEEARNTERHAYSGSDQRLRHTKVNFVSAGTLGGTKDAEIDMAKMTLEELSSEDKDEIVVVEEDENDDEEATETEERAPESQVSETEPSFFVDIQGSIPIQTGFPPPRVRSPSPAPSNSSEEVILFRGRDALGRGLPAAVPSSIKPIARASADPFDARIRVVEDMIHQKEELLEEVLREKKVSTLPLPPLVSEKRSMAGDDNEGFRKQGRGRGRGPKGKGKEAKDTEEQALIADYIAHIDPEELDAMTAFCARELGGTDDDAWEETEVSSGEPIMKTDKPGQARWNRSDIEDFDDLSTSDGVMGDVQAILSKRDRHRGVQYLVVWEETSVDEARWVPATTLISVQALSHIEKFEAEEKLVAEFMNPDSDDTTDSDDDDAEDDEDEDDVDDDLELSLEKRKAAMSDETIARLLAKQEELGMGSDELLLFDDADEEEVDEEELARRFPGTGRDFETLTFAPKQNRYNTRSTKISRAKGDFPSATMLADAYDGFDIMDHDRPSLKPKAKGRKGKMSFDLSDSELEASMTQAWENDRTKKIRRKQEREELRAAGLLGSKNGKPDLKQKYKEGMGIYAVKEEIKAFLLRTGDTSLALPPMDKADRKLVHEIANALKLKSSSQGKGNKRFPVLYRTSQTSFLTESVFAAAENRISRRFLPNMSLSGNSRSRGFGGGFGGARGSGTNNAAVSYRDGDIVGGSAPELGAENRGRAMLEKMGWSSGTALGAENNKGIMQPVTHVVKTTKAGLG